MTTDVENQAASPQAEGQAEPTAEQPESEPKKRRAASSPNRAASTMPGRRQQFKWAAEATEASSILAATWLEKPENVESGPGRALALFYFRQPKQGHQKHQVFEVTRKDDGSIVVKRRGEDKDAVQTYQRFYSPVIHEKRAERRAQREAQRKNKGARGRGRRSQSNGQAEQPAPVEV